MLSFGVWYGFPLKKKFDFPCLNFAAGYYNYHTKNEYVIVDDVQNAIDLGVKVVNTLGNKKYQFLYEAKSYPFDFL